MLLVGASACDVASGGRPADAVRILAIQPPHELERDGVVLLRLDAAIDPHSLLTSEAAIRSGGRELGASLRYDPVGRALWVDPTPARLDPDLDYHFRVDGPTSFEGRRLAPSTFTLRVVDALAPPPPPPIAFDEVERVLAGCVPCHGPEQAVLGLDVTDLVGTAIGVPAREVRAATFGPSLAGVQRIEPYHPERSYLLYKMLGEGPIVGDVMGSAVAPGVPLEVADLSIVSRWIAEGARSDAGGGRAEP